MTDRTIRGACLALPLWLFASAAHGVVETGALVLHRPISARAAAMGETGAADNSDAANIFFNPANVVGPARVYVQGSRWDLEPLFGGDLWIGGGSAGVSYVRPDSQLTVAADFSYGRFDYGESILTDPSGNILGVFESAEQYFALTLGAGFALGEKWNLRLGGAAKRWDWELVPDVQLDAFAFDVGVTAARRALVSGWRVTPAFAAAFVNLGNEIEVPEFRSSDPLPTRFHFGTSVRVDSPNVQVLGANVPLIAAVYNIDGIERLHGDRFSWGIGGELAVAQMLFIRAGSFDFADEGNSAINEGSGWGVGLGLPMGSFRARFDYTKTSAYYEDDKLGIELDWML